MKVRRAAVAAFALVLAGVGAVATAAPSSAGGPKPPAPVTISLTCDSGAYSTLSSVVLTDRNGIVVAGPVDLVCGGFAGNPWTATIYPAVDSVTVSPTSKPVLYSTGQWICNSTADVGGGGSTLVGAGKLAKNGPTVAACPTLAVNTPSGPQVTLSIG